MPRAEDVYLTTADALAYLRTTPRTLYRRLAKGEIPAVRMGHQWRFRKRDLDRWIEEQTGRQKVQEHNDSAAVPSAQRPRVLVADDEPGVCETLVSILALAECDVDVVHDGSAAVERVRSTAYDLVITDLSMPGRDGLDVAREAKRFRPGIKVLIVTGYPSQSSAIDAVNIGVNGYIVKPFRPMDVLIAAARALDLGSMGQERLA
jgi:excisionase family DNA binding protein